MVLSGRAGVRGRLHDGPSTDPGAPGARLLAIDGQAHRRRPPVAQELDADGAANRAVGDEPHELRRVRDRLAVDAPDDVARAQARLVGRRAAAHLGDHDAVGVWAR